MVVAAAVIIAENAENAKFLLVAKNVHRVCKKCTVGQKLSRLTEADIKGQILEIRDGMLRVKGMGYIENRNSR